MAPLISKLVADGHIEARAYHQRADFDTAVQFARTEGILPAPESAHTIKAAVDEVLAAREAGDSPVILFNLSGHGHFDLGAYEAYLAGKLEDFAYPADKVKEALGTLPRVG